MQPIRAAANDHLIVALLDKLFGLQNVCQNPRCSPQSSTTKFGSENFENYFLSKKQKQNQKFS